MAIEDMYWNIYITFWFFNFFHLQNHPFTAKLNKILKSPFRGQQMNVQLEIKRLKMISTLI